jgi:hypothetical protein
MCPIYNFAQICSLWETFWTLLLTLRLSSHKHMWLFYALWFFKFKILKLFGFPIFWLWVYLMKVIPETRVHTKLDIYVSMTNSFNFGIQITPISLLLHRHVCCCVKIYRIVKLISDWSFELRPLTWWYGCC